MKIRITWDEQNCTIPGYYVEIFDDAGELITYSGAWDFPVHVDAFRDRWSLEEALLKAFPGAEIEAD